ncbi:MAG: LD-carboxypeptidase [Bacillota bacterium]|nr:LD-carboxypeptidase [Bacillota bacterium]
MRKPKTLRPDSHIALVAPSSPVSDEKLAMSVASMEFIGLRYTLYPSCTMKHGYLSGPDAQRARDLNDAFGDPDIDGIFCLRGGYGATRLLPLLDYETIRRNPKVFIGYSDITALHTAFGQLCGFTTIHSPMPTRGWDTLDSLSLDLLKKALFSGKPAGPAPVPLRLQPGPRGEPAGEPLAPETLVPGQAQAPLCGGNLSLLTATLGSPYEIDCKNKILFIEDVGAPHYAIDRDLTALSLAGKFRDCAGLIFGTFTDVPPLSEDGEGNLELRQILEEVAAPWGKPAILNFQAGHSYPFITLPFGTEAFLDASSGGLNFLEAPTA